VLRGGFQQCMAQLWPSSKLLRSERPALFASVRPERWAEHGEQGLVWKGDLDPLADLAESLATAVPPFLPRTFPSAFRKLSGGALRAAVPYVCEVYGPHTAAAAIPGAAHRSRELGALLHLRFHSIPYAGDARRQRLAALLAAAAIWLCAFAWPLKLRTLVCASLYSALELAFTAGERGRPYTSLAQFVANLLYVPVLLDTYGALLAARGPLLYALLFPLNVWLLELIVGHAIAWLHGRNVAWCYADYADAFGNGCARLGHAPAWLALGAVCYVAYPWMVEATEGSVAP